MSAICALPAPPRAAIIQVDPRACRFQVAAPMGSPHALPPGSAAINCNYFWKGRPIGALLEDGKIAPYCPTAKARALLVIEDQKPRIEVLPARTISQNLRGERWRKCVVIQAGPELIRDGRIVLPDSHHREQFRRDVYRRTRHTAIGITRQGKILLLFAYDRTLRETAVLLQRAGAISGLNMDGGSSSCLIWHRHYGTSHPKTLLVARPR
jgi:exopolysaccharide biosynthesis protein